MPTGDDVHHKTAVAAIFWTETVRMMMLLLDEFRVRHEQAGTGDAVVIVVLTVNSWSLCGRAAVH